MDLIPSMNLKRPEFDDEAPTTPRTPVIPESPFIHNQPNDFDDAPNTIIRNVDKGILDAAKPGFDSEPTRVVKHRARQVRRVFAKNE